MIDIIQAVETPEIFGNYLNEQKNSFSNWKVFLKTVHGLHLNKKERKVYKKFTGRSKPSKKPFERVFCASGRQSGKTLIASLCALHTCLFEDFWVDKIPPGKEIVFLLIATDMVQAREAFNYCTAILNHSSQLRKKIVNQRAWDLELERNVVLKIRQASHVSVRAPQYCGAILDEIAFLHTDDTYVNPASSIIRAIMPALVPGGRIWGISSVFSKFDILFESYEAFWGKNNPDTLFWLSDTLSMHPLFDTDKIKRALKEDRSAAMADYYSVFQDEKSNFLPEEIINRAIVKGQTELPYDSEVERYYAFADSAQMLRKGGDEFAFSLCHIEKDEEAEEEEEKTIFVVDKLVTWTPPADVKNIEFEILEICQEYKINQIWMDRVAIGFTTSFFREHGIKITPSPKTKSQIYETCGYMLNRDQVDLIDNKKLRIQAMSLERRLRSGGRAEIDAMGGRLKDDAVNVVFGALVMCNDNKRPPMKIEWI